MSPSGSTQQEQVPIPQWNMKSDSIPQWNMKSDYVETCNCDFGCPCNFSGFPTYVDIKLMFYTAIDNNS